MQPVGTRLGFAVSGATWSHSRAPTADWTSKESSHGPLWGRTIAKLVCIRW